jgi:putative transposon-encoded protein
LTDLVKGKTTIHHNVRTVLKSNRETRRNSDKIDIPNTHIFDLPPSFLC